MKAPSEARCGQIGCCCRFSAKQSRSAPAPVEDEDAAAAAVAAAIRGADKPLLEDDGEAGPNPPLEKETLAGCGDASFVPNKAAVDVAAGVEPNEAKLTVGDEAEGRAAAANRF